MGAEEARTPKYREGELKIGKDRKKTERGERERERRGRKKRKKREREGKGKVEEKGKMEDRGIHLQWILVQISV